MELKSPTCPHGIPECWACREAKKPLEAEIERLRSALEKISTQMYCGDDMSYFAQQVLAGEKEPIKEVR